MKKGLLLFLAVALFVSCTPAKIEVRSTGVALKDNTVVHYLEAGQGPALVLVHGLGASSEVWRDSMMLLARSYRVIAPDLPGHGKSDRPRAAYSVEYYAASLNDFLDALGLRSVAVAGNSLGGWIAALTALDHPDKVGHLVIVAGAGLRTDRLPPVNLNPATKEDQRVLLTALFADPSLVTEQMVNDQWEERRTTRATVQATLESFKTSLPFVDERLKNIRIPTLIIWGRQDRLIPVDFGERFRRGISGSKLVVLENTGHLPQMEKPKEFARAVKGFVRSW